MSAGRMILSYMSHRELWECPLTARHRQGTLPAIDEAVIPLYEGEAAAEAAGWVKTSNWRFCPEGKPYVWVCPDCMRGFER